MPLTSNALAPVRTRRAEPFPARSPAPRGPLLWKIAYLSCETYTIEQGGHPVDRILVPSQTTATVLIEAPPGARFIEPYIHWQRGLRPFKSAVNLLRESELEIVQCNESQGPDGQAFAFQPVFENGPLLPFLGTHPILFHEGNPT